MSVWYKIRLFIRPNVWNWINSNESLDAWSREWEKKWWEEAMRRGRASEHIIWATFSWCDKYTAVRYNLKFALAFAYRFWYGLGFVWRRTVPLLLCHSRSFCAYKCRLVNVEIHGKFNIFRHFLCFFLIEFFSRRHFCLVVSGSMFCDCKISINTYTHIWSKWKEKPNIKKKREKEKETLQELSFSSVLWDVVERESIKTEHFGSTSK